jgi:hypothetical protein
MAKKPLGDFNLDIHLPNILDEILFRDPQDAIRQSSCENGYTRVKEVISFADGSKLTIMAEVPLPRKDEMTSTAVLTIKHDGTKGQVSDDGSNEALSLARQSIAIRLMAQISSMLDSLPVREKVNCPTCDGRKWCESCGGMGCDECKGTGLCQDCGGRGKIPIL